MNQVIEFLSEQSDMLDSRALKVAAVSLVDSAVSGGHLKAVIEELEKYEAKLSAAKDAYTMDHYCKSSTELNKRDVKHLKENFDALTGETDGLKATIVDCDLALEKEHATVKATQKSVKEENAVREEERASNEKTIFEATEAGEACDKAARVLKEFYAGASKAETLAANTVTASDHEMAADYTGSTSGSSVITMIEQAHTNFIGTATDAENAERKAVEDHEIFLATAARTTKKCEAIIRNWSDKKSNAAKDLAQYAAELETTTEQYEAAKSMKEKLFHECDYEGEKQQRLKKEREDKQAAELKAIGKALEILRKNN